ncbi:MAG: hypothetical protein UU71_C0013G0005 [Parcubacteria group bacterium GW2011_GWB1_41_6]|nr:MAG: hypothetical protein UU71_C0013G0005 [Parcubacteria group bacterium GW2011_GWB1_41_6]KKS57199.1 MAG: hypothetical protein UV22_C0021G0007 [Parcubacteria group bacterium GW2011_GWA2_42_35]
MKTAVVSRALSVRNKRAHEIMGRNFFGVEEAIIHLRVKPTRQQLAALSEIPFSEAVLEQSKDTHILEAVFPLSILEIRGKVDQKLFYSLEYVWYNKESFAKKRGEVNWQLVRKTPVDISTLKNGQEQQALLIKDDKVPSARVMVYTIIGHYLATDEWLFKNIHVLTSSVDSGGLSIYVGFFDSEFDSEDVYFFSYGSLRVDNFYWANDRHDYLAVSVR